MEQKRKMGSEYSRKWGIKKRSEFSRGEKWKSEERGEGSTTGTKMEHRRQM